MIAQRWTIGLLIGGLFVSAVPSAHSDTTLGPANVLVLYNTASPDGLQIANSYAQLHPGVTLLGLDNVTTNEEITADYYLSNIRPQIVNHLTSSTDVIVTTKGLPLRIAVTESNPGTYTDPSNQQHTVYSDSWKTYSSLESELTRVDTISTWQQMGDQSYWMPGTPQITANPYYQSSSAFSYTDFGIRLTSRLDGFTASDVINSLNRAQNVNVAGQNFIVDDDPSKSYDPSMASLASNVLGPRGLNYVYDHTSAFVGTSSVPVLGYVSHGRNQASTPANYIMNSTTGLQFTPAAGAVFETWESYNAYSFQPGGNRGGQGLVAEWLARGGTAGVGTVEEPGASTESVTNEDKMFDMLLSGQSFVEAAWSATEQLSFVNTVVGDPLMVWHLTSPGTYSVSDYNNIANNFGRIGWGVSGDLNNDGLVDVGDFNLFTNNVFQQSKNNNANFGGTVSAVPELSGACLLLAAAISLAGHRALVSAWRCRKRPSRFAASHCA